MFLLLFLIFAARSFHSTASTITQKMVVVWGTPDSTYGCVKHEGSTWDQCLKNCTETENCVTAVLDTTETCYLCDFKNAADVMQTTKADKMKVGFKIKVDTSVDKCPKGENPPTFGNQPAEGDASTTTEDGKIQNYTISFTGIRWEFKKFSMARCIAGYFFSVRPTIDWCMAVIYKGRDLPYTEAQSICTNYAATVKISGIQNQLEIEGLIYQLNRLRERNSLSSVHAFLDGERTAECQGTPKTAECMSLEGFTTVDRTVGNLDAYNFMTDSSAGAADGKNCMVIVWDAENDGKVDFQRCDSGFDYPIWATVCGHEALT